MRALRQLIREVIRGGDQDASSDHFSFKTSTLDDLSSILLEMFGRHGEWMFSTGDPEVVALRRRFGIPVEYIADGSYRITFSIGNDLVLKLSKDSLGAVPEGDPKANQMNMDDWTLGTDTSIGNIVPRAYEHAADFSWVVLERVEPLKHEEDFFRFFETPLLPYPNDLSEKGREDYMSLIRILLDMKNYMLQRPLQEDDTLKSYFLRSSELVRMSPNPDVPLPEIRSSLMRTSPTFRHLASALKRYKIRVSEIHGGNVGIGSDDRLVLLDSSIFPS